MGCHLFLKLQSCAVIFSSLIHSESQRAHSHCDGLYCREAEGSLACSAPLNACMSLSVRNGLESYSTGKQSGGVRVLSKKTWIRRDGINE